jgi:hypothetical protein
MSTFFEPTDDHTNKSGWVKSPQPGTSLPICSMIQPPTEIIEKIKEIWLRFATAQLLIV